MARADTQPVRLSSELITKLKTYAQEAGQSLPAEVEARLRDSLQRGAWSSVEPQLSPRARAIGWLTAFLTNELLRFGKPADQAEHLRMGVARIMQRLDPGARLESPANDAEMMADYWWLRIMNANERTYEAGVPRPKSSEDEALLQIRTALFPPEAPQTQKPQKGRR